MKPDLGLHHLKTGHRQNVEMFFYDITFADIGFIAPHVYSVMLNYLFNDIVHSLFFDFSDDILAQLLSKLPSDSREQFGQSIVGNNFPFLAKLPLKITAGVVECHLGEIVQVAPGTCVPFIITRIE